MEYRFRILRFDPSAGEGPRFRDFVCEADGKTTVLEALTAIREEQDGTLAFRHSCREAVCGSCAMAINGRPELACRTLLGSTGSRTVVVEPLPSFDVRKDLVVDLEPFFEAYRRLEPFISPEPPPEKGHRIGGREMDRITPFVNCILCGCCHAACPVVSRDGRYPGPAALAKLYRFVADPRDRRPFDRWSAVDTETGAWGCDTVFRCNEACPRDVRPADGISALRRKLIAGMIRKVLRLKR